MRFLDFSYRAEMLGDIRKSFFFGHFGGISVHFYTLYFFLVDSGSEVFGSR